MKSVEVELDERVQQYVEQHSRENNLTLEQTVNDLVNLGFDTLLERHYKRYRHGEISFGRVAQELGITTWELTDVIEKKGWVIHNLPLGDSG
jgi:hypothetical protein